MSEKLLGRLDERRLKYLLVAFFVALAVPTALLVRHAYGQLEWEALRRNQVLAEDLVERIDSELRAAVATEEARSFSDYSFLVVEGDATTNFVQKSALSAVSAQSAIPGALGYFQVGPDGAFSTPLLPADPAVDPASFGIAAEDLRARRALALEVSAILAENRLLLRSLRFEEADAAQSAPPGAPALDYAVAPGAPSPVGAAGAAPSREQAAGAMPSAANTQSAFDRLRSRADLYRIQDGASSAASVQLTAPAEVPAAAFADDASSEAANATAEGAGGPIARDVRSKRVEQSLSAEPGVVAAASEAEASEAATVELRVRTFESELEPFMLGWLETGHLVLFRSAWRDGSRYIQGVLIESDAFAARALEAAFRASSVAALSALEVSYRGTLLAAVNAASTASSYATASPSQELAGTWLHRARLSPPFGDLELAFTVNRLPRAPGAILLAWVSVVLSAVLCGGFFLIYRFAVGQLRLTRQQQDFVSAVSHELKTPLTSIRMYGEMLKSGWADDARKQTYYEYIHGESERLSRLIDNVLQLARLTRNTQRFDLKSVEVGELLDLVRSKAATQIERAGFALEIGNEAQGTAIRVDSDCFTQIAINLVDNAVKFAATAERKSVVITARRGAGDSVLFTVRDYGPGIPKGQMRKIFELFYRPADAATRATAGTGIGLALVKELTTAMGGQIDVRNCTPGAEFRVSFPLAKPPATRP